MTWIGLNYKGVEPVTPEEWNLIVDAFNALADRIKGGIETFTGDGSTTVFSISHGLGVVPMIVFVGKASADTPDIDYWDADTLDIIVRLKSAPADQQTFKLHWLAIKSLP